LNVSCLDQIARLEVITAFLSALSHAAPDREQCTALRIPLSYGAGVLKGIVALLKKAGSAKKGQR